MGLGTLARMMGRRLALRKGLAVSAAVLLLLGWCLLYVTTSGLDGTKKMASRQPAVPVSYEGETACWRREMYGNAFSLQPASMPADVVAGPVKQPENPAPVNLSIFPPDLRLPPPIPRNPYMHLPQGPERLKDSVSQCGFTEVTQVAPVDLQVRLQQGLQDNSIGFSCSFADVRHF